MTTRADRRSRRASTLRAGDFVHSGLVPMRVTGWENDLLVGVTAAGGRVWVTHPPGRPLDVTRLVDGPDGGTPRMTEPNLAFIALSATGPSCEFNEIWELSVRLTVPGGRAMESHWQFPVINLPRASAYALKSAGFYDRHRRPKEPVELDMELGTARPTSFEEIARALARHLVDAHPVSLNPDHELPHLATFLRRYNQPATWPQVVPLTAMAAGQVYGYNSGWNAHVQQLGPDAAAVPRQLHRTLKLSPGPLPWSAAQLAEAIVPDLPELDDVTAPGRLAVTVALWGAITQPPPASAPAAPPAAQAPTDTLVAV